MSQPPNFIFIGRSGCGKGTQTQLLIKDLASKGQDMFYISSGDLFRDLAKQDSQVGHLIAQTVSDGRLPMDELATSLWTHTIAYKTKAEQGILFDGAPRKVWEAEHLDRFMNF